MNVNVIRRTSISSGIVRSICFSRNLDNSSAFRRYCHQRRVNRQYRLFSNQQHQRIEEVDDNYSNFDSNSSIINDSSNDDIDSPLERYKSLVNQNILNKDDHQFRIILLLNDLYNNLKDYNPSKLSELDDKINVNVDLNWWQRIVSGKSVTDLENERDQAIKDKQNEIPQGLYLYGDVGTGKSMLMDLFHSTVPSNFKSQAQRWHFHAFMQSIHKKIHLARLQKQQDPLDYVTQNLANECKILCFDEFQVVDIVDAMILRRLFDGLINRGVVTVMTSNRHPDDLYLNGIQRDSFIPCIHLLKSKFEVVDLNSGTDYRKLPRTLNKTYFSPIDKANIDEFEKLFTALTNSDDIVHNRQLEVWGRKLFVPLSSKIVARFTFHELCGKPLSAADYLEVVNNFDVIMIDEIPKLTLNVKDQARRFITFIDAAYESKVRLFLLSEVPIEGIFTDESSNSGEITDVMRSAMDDLGLNVETIGASSMFTGQEEIFAFARAVSRLTEMSSRQYAEMAKNSQQ